MHTLDTLDYYLHLYLGISADFILDKFLIINNIYLLNAIHVLKLWIINNLKKWRQNVKRSDFCWSLIVNNMLQRAIASVLVFGVCSDVYRKGPRTYRSLSRSVRTSAGTLLPGSSGIRFSLARCIELFQVSTGKQSPAHVHGRTGRARAG